MDDIHRLDDYQQKIVSMYGARAAGYDNAPNNADWHRRTADHLVQRARLRAGQRVLDIATGTGLVAFEAAEKVGPDGFVLGIDITRPMLEQARIKAQRLNVGHVRFAFADAENLCLQEAPFDHVLCCAALVLMRDVAKALHQWMASLAPGGWIGLQTNTANAFITYKTIERLAAREGIELRFNREIGSPERLAALLEAAGFTEIDIETVADGRFLSMAEALAYLPGSEFLAFGQTSPPFRHCTQSQMARIRAGYKAAMSAALTPHGIWDDCTSLFARARRPE